MVKAKNPLHEQETHNNCDPQLVLEFELRSEEDIVRKVSTRDGDVLERSKSWGLLVFVSKGWKAQINECEDEIKREVDPVHEGVLKDVDHFELNDLAQNSKQDSCYCQAVRLQ